MPTPKADTATVRKRFAVIGAGMAGIACARTLVQAGHEVHVFEKSQGFGGRMATRSTPFGGFDHGAQYFTVRDARFAKALGTVPGLCKAWSANAIRVLDEHGSVALAPLPGGEAHLVPTPGMNALVRRWAKPLVASDSVTLGTEVTAIERDPMDKALWQLRTKGLDDAHHVETGFDAVVLAVPHVQALKLLPSSAPKSMAKALSKVTVDPCWTLMLAFPHATQPGLTTLGPQWNAARSNHHRIAWLTRESSKPGRDPLERWTVQASSAWSLEHLEDSPERVKPKLLRAFAEVTGIRAEPSHTDVHRWRYAKTNKPLGASHLWDAKQGIGVCGDWALGHRVEDAFVSGLEMALTLA